MATSSAPNQVPISALVLAVALLPLAAGCGDGKFPVRAAKGNVESNGQPVTTGSVTFTPIAESGREAGKPATATVGADGTFVLSTNSRFDGAVVGKHSVHYVGSEDEEEAETEAPAEGSPEEAAQNAKRIQSRQASRPRYVQQGEIIVEVKASGENHFTIQLAPAGKSED